MLQRILIKINCCFFFKTSQSSTLPQIAPGTFLLFSVWMKNHNGAVSTAIAASVGINEFPNKLQPTFKNASCVLGWSSDPVLYIPVIVHSVPLLKEQIYSNVHRDLQIKGHNFLFRVNTFESRQGLQETKTRQLLPHMLEQFILVWYSLQWSKASCYLSPMYMFQIETPLKEQRRRRRKRSVILN